MRQVANKAARAPRHPWRDVRWLWQFGLTVTFGMVLFGAAILIGARTEAWRESEQSSANLTLALARDIDRNLTTYDLSLQGAIDAMHRPDIDQISPETRHMAIFDRAASAEYLGSLLILDRYGDVLADSTALIPHKLNLADRDYFRAHQFRSDVGPFISRPFASRLRGGDLGIAISRRMNGDKGEFQGVAVGAMRLEYFRQLFAALDLGVEGAVALFRDDGRLLMRRPFRDDDVDQDFSAGPDFQQMRKAQSGSFVVTSSTDGTRHLIAFRRIDAWKLILTVAVGVDEINNRWLPKSIGIGAVLLMLCGLILLLFVLFREEVLHRAAAEEAYLEAAANLQALSPIDSLTRLLLRPAFEVTLGTEWQRAVRAETAISLLVVDVDGVRSFREVHGRQETDRALQRIANCIRHRLLRAGDIAARTGDDEFMILLPETEPSGARVVADGVRVAIEALYILHGKRPLTVSVGLATALPGLHSTEAVLIARATAAMGAAKAAGKNRVGVADSIVAAQDFPMPVVNTAQVEVAKVAAGLQAA